MMQELYLSRVHSTNKEQSRKIVVAITTINERIVPMNSLAELPSERQCHKQLFKIVWGDYTCPGCSSSVKFTDKYAWCRNCRKKYFVRSETWCKYSKLPFQKLWLLIWCWQRKKGVGATCDIVGITYTTINRWFKRFRQALPKSECLLSGFVAADESFIGKRKFGRQRLVMGVIEKTKQPDTGKRRVRLSIIPNREMATLESWLLDRVSGGSHIDTDKWWGYNDLNLIGFSHSACDHSKGQFAATNHIENFWGVMKRHMRVLYQRLTITDLDLFLREWENRQNNPKLFYNVISYLQLTVCSGLVG
jgi:transposase-like protein